MSVELDKAVADFQAEATSGQQVKLSALKGQQVVLYFYPKDATPGCTTEGMDFSARFEQFKAANTLIFGAVSYTHLDVYKRQMLVQVL